MHTIKVYSTTYCPYCTAAKKLLTELGLPFEEIDVTQDAQKRAWLVQNTGQRTVPQIFVGDKAIGGYTDLAALVRSGESQALL